LDILTAISLIIAESESNQYAGIKTMRHIIRVIILLIFVVFLSCEKQGFIVNCSDCTTDEPTKTNLEIKLNDRYFLNTVKIDVYEGNLEDKVLYSSFAASTKNTTISVTINKKYTVTATYYISGNSYFAVDSATPGIKYEKNQCNNPCYFVYDRQIDLRIKHF
jgi:hypothetical protein